MTGFVRRLAKPLPWQLVVGMALFLAWQEERRPRRRTVEPVRVGFPRLMRMPFEGMARRSQDVGRP
jgi:hypothetical protein